MNVREMLPIVIIMLIVKIQMDLSTVSAPLDILEMVHHVKVSVYLKLHTQLLFRSQAFLFCVNLLLETLI